MEGRRFKSRPEDKVLKWLYKWLDFLGLSRIRTINLRLRLTVLLWDVKEPTHRSERVGNDVLGVMVYHLV